MSALNPSRVAFERVALRRAGYLPVIVRTGGKNPVEGGWEKLSRARSVEEWEAFAVYGEAMNTGILTHGLCAVDIDVDDPATANVIQNECMRLLGLAPLRFRENSGRCLLLYRVQGGMKKVSVAGTHGKVEALGNKQQFVAFGTHESGVPYQWNSDLLSIPCDTLNEVTADQVSVFFEAIRRTLGATQDAPQQVQATVQLHQVPATPPVVTEREREYARAALQAELEKLVVMLPGQGRNNALNVAAHSLGTMSGAGWIDPMIVAAALWDAAERNGYVAKHDSATAAATIRSGVNAGMLKPREPLVTGNAASVSIRLPDPRNIATPARSVELVSMHDIAEEETRWLWPGYLPSGMLTLLSGAGGTGKSTIAFSLAAIVSTAGLWPDKRRCERVGNVLIWSSEDDIKRTIKPRLIAAGADDTRIAVVRGAIDQDGVHLPFDPATDIPKLRERARQLQDGVALFIIDPIVSAVSGDMHKANDVRRSLQAVVDFAAELDCAVLGITHFAKNTGGRNTADRVIGSQAFAAFARMVLATAKEEETDRRVFTRAKSNISPDDGGFHYTIEPVSIVTRGGKTLLPTRIAWGNAIEGSARAILADVEDETQPTTKAIDVAKGFLHQVLGDGEMAAKDVERKAADAGIALRTLRRAREAMGIVTRKSGMQGVSVWLLPYQAEQRQLLR